MAKIPVTNNTKRTMFVHGIMIPGGETRHIDENDVPLHLRPAPANVEEEKPAAPAADPLAELATRPVKEITAAMQELSTESLERLRVIEEASDTPRKTLLAAIDEEILDRAIAAEEAATSQEAGRAAPGDAQGAAD